MDFLPAVVTVGVLFSKEQVSALRRASERGRLYVLETGRDTNENHKEHKGIATDGTSAVMSRILQLSLPRFGCSAVLMS